jgi:hypothetical protein
MSTKTVTGPITTTGGPITISGALTLNDGSSGGTAGGGGSGGGGTGSDPVGDLEGNWNRADNFRLGFQTSIDGKRIQMYISGYPLGSSSFNINRTGDTLTMYDTQGGMAQGSSCKMVVAGATLTVSACTDNFQTGLFQDGEAFSNGSIAGTYTKQ